jgi:cyanophycinase
MVRWRAVPAAVAFWVLSAAQVQGQPAETRVGPPKGTVIVVGGGAIGPEIYARFIEAAGGPDALIVDIPTAGGDSVYPATWRGANPWRRAGARNVVVLHTLDKAVANSDSVVAILNRAGGVWFEGGRQWRLADAYLGTRTEQGFHDVLARGGVVGGSSAGASILSGYMLRGARSGNTIIMAPDSDSGFNFLRGVAIDQHVVARERLKDLADSLLPRRPDLLGISEDEGTAWIIQGDTGVIMGRNKAFVYGGEHNDAGKPFLTLFPGDRYDLAARRLIGRAADGSGLSEAYLDSLMPNCGTTRCTILVARDGRVLVDKAWGIPAHPRYMPGTTVPNFPLGGLSAAFTGLGRQLIPDSVAPGSAAYARLLTQRIYTPIGARKTVLDATGGAPRFESSVDELYRLELGLQHPGTWVRDTLAASSDAAVPVDPGRGWKRETYHGLTRLSLFGTENRKRAAWMRFPDRKVTVIILSDDERLEAGSIAEQISDRVLTPR